jgi:DNA polymerase elongation subunit (family B)
VSDDVLVWDAEVTPNIVYTWATGRKITILPESIKKERQMCVIGYRWLGQKQTRTLTWGKDADEKSMVREAIVLLNRARFSIAHNGDRFDLRWLRGRAMYYRLPMAPHYSTVDTLKIMQRLAYLNSHKLDYLGKYFKIGQKIKTSYDLWTRIADTNHQPSLKEMARYCRQDVDLLMEFYLEFRPWFPAPPNSIARQISDCPYCGGSQTIVNKQRRTAAGHDKVQFVCRDCGQYHTVAKGRYDKAKSKAAA